MKTTHPAGHKKLHRWILVPYTATRGATAADKPRTNTTELSPNKKTEYSNNPVHRIDLIYFQHLRAESWSLYISYVQRKRTAQNKQKTPLQQQESAVMVVASRRNSNERFCRSLAAVKQYSSSYSSTAAVLIVVQRAIACGSSVVLLKRTQVSAHAESKSTKITIVAATGASLSAPFFS